jgi:hypothetical protein
VDTPDGIKSVTLGHPRATIGTWHCNWFDTATIDAASAMIFTLPFPDDNHYYAIQRVMSYVGYNDKHLCRILIDGETNFGMVGTRYAIHGFKKTYQKVVTSSNLLQVVLHNYDANPAYAVMDLDCYRWL